jgi:hypothetical protein
VTSAAFDSQKLLVGVQAIHIAVNQISQRRAVAYCANPFDSTCLNPVGTSKRLESKAVIDVVSADRLTPECRLTVASTLNQIKCDGLRSKSANRFNTEERRQRREERLRFEGNLIPSIS